MNFNLGLCLAGGGVKGAAHIGAIKAIEEAGLKINYIAGTSSGSIVAALYAAGFSTDEMYLIFKKYCKKIKYVDFFNIIKLIFGLIFSGKIIIDGLNSGIQLEKLINKECGKKNIKNISDISMPLLIPSVDMATGNVICFTSKMIRKEFEDNIIFINNANIGKAVRGSCSYPVIFSPCKYENIKLIDGGIRENVPWKEIKLLGANKVLNVTFDTEVDEDCCKNLIDVAGRSLELLCRELSNYEMEGAEYTVKIKSSKMGLLDMKYIDDLYNIGYEQTKEYLKKLTKNNFE
mgnify:CR=1 FL=1